MVAVSGGVDSVVLLDLLSRQKSLELVVAHFDHGIRSDSAKDEELVKSLTEKYRTFHYAMKKSRLGKNVSEEKARQKRYAFLEATRQATKSIAIVTAHHQDDLIETALINLIRGTGWRGLASLRNTATIRRPLLQIPKADIRDYAVRHRLKWCEDSTNQDTRYLRNYIRHQLIPFVSKQDSSFRPTIVRLVNEQVELREAIDGELDSLFVSLASIEANSFSLPRTRLIMMPNAISSELLYYGISMLTGVGERRPNLYRALHFIKTARLYKTHQMSGSVAIIVKKGTVVVYRR